MLSQPASNLETQPANGDIILIINILNDFPLTEADKNQQFLLSLCIT